MITSRRRLQRLASALRRYAYPVLLPDRHLLVEPLEERRLLALVTWTGDGEDFDWGNAANWDLQRVPAADDDVVVDVPGEPIIFGAPRLIAITEPEQPGSSEFRRRQSCASAAPICRILCHRFSTTASPSTAGRSKLSVRR